MKSAYALYFIAFALLFANANAACATYSTDTRILSGIMRDVWGCANTSINGTSSISISYTCGNQTNTTKPACKVPGSGWACALDFERALGNDLWMAQLTIDTVNRVPIYNNSVDHPTVHNYTQFAKWYLDDPFNIPFPLNLTISNAGTCNSLIYAYSNANFFPIDYLGFGNQYILSGTPHNYGFTFNFHARFTYQGNEAFFFSGDDDVFVFINDKLAIDIGGVHARQNASIDLTWPTAGCPTTTAPKTPCSTPSTNYTTATWPCACLLGLTKGSSYAFDLFYNERHTIASDLEFSTSLLLQCPWYDWCGVCQGTGQTCCKCNDNNNCTTDTCDVLNGTCVYTPVACTATNSCSLASCDPKTGNCIQTIKNCSATNPCQIGGCNPSSGCTLVNVTCDDANPCTIDTCNTASGCVYTNMNCSDNNPCTTDSCSGGSCSNVPISCNAGNSCTNNTCDPAGPACSYPSIASKCVTGNKCLIEGCSNSTGCFSSAVNCDDGKACTVDTCNNATGCVYTTLNCNDNNACTSDSCSNSTGCINTAINCNRGNSCETYQCLPASGCLYTTVNCDDNNACTIDSCDAASGCKHLAVNCDDGMACTNDTCSASTGCQYSLISCNDNSACTTDSCSNTTGCVNIAINCDDGDICTNDTCNAAAANASVACQHVIIPCDRCINKTCPFTDLCFPQSCDPGNGSCIVIPLNCNDGNPCTNDSCVNGACHNDFYQCPYTNSCLPATCVTSNGQSQCQVNPVSCDDNNLCTFDSCNGTGSSAQCIHKDNTCNNADACFPQRCNQTDGGCNTFPVNCDDANPCTTDSCLNGVCSHVFNDCNQNDPCNPQACDLTNGQCITHPVVCNDNNACTNDTCIVVGSSYSCQFTPVVCAQPNLCAPTSCVQGQCISTPIICNDNNLCTNDSCVVTDQDGAICQFKSVDCTIVDACFTGRCANGQCVRDAVPCSDGDLCTADGCNSTTGCTFTPISCDDGNACTVDTCDSQKGCVYNPLVCDDSNACTNNTCNTTSGCSFPPIEVPLGDVCTGIYCDPKLGIIRIPTQCPTACTGGCSATLGGCQGCPGAGGTNIVEIAGISAGIIAAIVIASVIAVALFIYTGKKGIEMLYRKKENMGTISDNPFYLKSTKEQDNPLYNPTNLE